MKPFFKKYPTVLFIALFFGLVISGCISNILKEKIPVFSEEITFTPPPSFKQIKSAYPSWKNGDTQNVIAIISNCDDNKYSPNYAYMIISENVENPKVENSKIDNLSLPKQVAKQIHGSVEEEAIEVQTLSFQHKNCVYISALSGRPNSIAKDFDHWKAFLKSIELKK
ncbi:MAG: hypothetical protein H7235_04265 [Bdellovibrionaceae bacterium]|nr:hypothetical protein [Pseudobdellovibrionaceae bacterium]